MRRMLLEILPKRHRLFHHLVMQLRGIEQVQTVGMPDGKP